MLAFGETVSGKTHTLFGGEGDMQGLLPRAASALLAISVLDEEAAIDLLSAILVIVRGGVGELQKAI